MTAAPAFSQEWRSCPPREVAALLFDGWHMHGTAPARNARNGAVREVAIMRRPLVLADGDS